MHENDWDLEFVVTTEQCSVSSVNMNMNMNDICLGKDEIQNLKYSFLLLLSHHFQGRKMSKTNSCKLQTTCN